MKDQSLISLALNVLIYILFLLGVGNGELLDDILRHGSHDIFWCFQHERKVSSYLNIKTNKKENELTYAAYHARISYSSLYKQKHTDLDLLFPPQRAIHVLHKNLKISTSRHGIQGMFFLFFLSSFY